MFQRRYQNADFIKRWRALDFPTIMLESLHFVIQYFELESFLDVASSTVLMSLLGLLGEQWVSQKKNKKNKKTQVLYTVPSP